jgi:hypothetical protein
MKNIFSTVGNFFKTKFFPKASSFLKSVFTSAITAAIAEIQDVVTETVKELSYETLTNSEKRSEAYKRIVAKLKAEGKEISESVIRTTIELAVLELKNSVGVKTK